MNLASQYCEPNNVMKKKKLKTFHHMLKVHFKFQLQLKHTYLLT